MAWLFPTSIVIGVLLFLIRFYKFPNFHLSFLQTQFLMGLHQASFVLWVPALVAFWFYDIKIRFNIDTLLCWMAFSSAITVASIGHPSRQSHINQQYHRSILLSAVLILAMSWFPYIGPGLIQSNLQKVAGLNQETMMQRDNIRVVKSPALHLTYAPHPELQAWQIRGAFEYKLKAKNDFHHLSPKKILAFKKMNSYLYVRFTDVHWGRELENRFSLSTERQLD